MSIQRKGKKKNVEQESEIKREDTEEGKEEQDDTAEISKETVKVMEEESVKEEEEAEQMADGDLCATKHLKGAVQESAVEITPINVELVREADMEGSDAVKQEKMENMEQVIDIKEEILQEKFVEKTCVEKAKRGTPQETKDVENKEKLIKTNVEESKDVMPVDVVVKEQIGDVMPEEEKQNVMAEEAAAKEEKQNVMAEEAAAKEEKQNVMPEEAAAKEQIEDVMPADTAAKEQIKDVTPIETPTKEKTCVQPAHFVKEVSVEQKVVTMEETTNEERGEKDSRTGVGEAAHECSPHPHTLSSPQNETENGSDQEFFNFEDFEVVDELEDEDEQEEEVERDRDQTKQLSPIIQRPESPSSNPSRRKTSHRYSSGSSRTHHSHSSYSRDRVRRDKEDAKDKSGSTSRSSRTSSRYREERSRQDYSRSQRRRDNDRSSNKRRERQKSPRRGRESDKTHDAKKRSAEDKGSSSNRIESLHDNQRSRKDTSLPKNDRETSLCSLSEKPARSPSTSRRQNSLENEGSSSTSQDVTKEEKSGTQEASQGHNTPPGSDGIIDCEPKVTCLDSNVDNTEATRIGTVEKEEKMKTQTYNKEQEGDNKDIQVKSEKQKLNDKELEVNKDDLQVTKKDLLLEVKNTEVESATTRCEIIDKEINSNLELDPVNKKNKEVEAISSQLKSNKDSDTKAEISEASNKQLEKQMNESATNNKEIELQLKEEKQMNESATNNKEIELQSKEEKQMNESATNNKEIELQAKESEESNKELKPHTESESLLDKGSVNIKKSEPEEPESKVMIQTLNNTQQEPSEASKVITKQSQPSKKEPSKVKEEETGISTRTRSARKKSVPLPPPKRTTRSQRKMPQLEVIDEAKTKAAKETVDKTHQELCKRKTVLELEQLCEKEVCSQNTSLKETVTAKSVCEESQQCILLKTTAGEEVLNEDSERSSLLRSTPGDLCKKEEANEDCKDMILPPKKCEKEDSVKENNDMRKNKSSSVIQEEGDKCSTTEENVEHCKIKYVLDAFGQENIREGKPQTTQQEQPQDITQDKDQPRHFHQDNLTNTTKKDEGHNIQQEENLKCTQEISQENVANTSQAEDKCETGQNTIEEKDKPTQATDEKKNSCRNDTDSSQIDCKNNKRPLESVEECSQKRRKESATGLSSAEHENNEEKENRVCTGEIKDSDKEKDSTTEIEMQEPKTLETSSKESPSKEVKRYSKVVVVGDARMSLLATTEFKEQLWEAKQIIIVPNLSLNGILEVVQKEVVKEQCPRGILLLCLAGLHDTLVEYRVPAKCRMKGHTDMHLMVPAAMGDSLDSTLPMQLANLKEKLLQSLGKGSNVLFFPVLPVDMTSYNEETAEHHFEATGHKVEHFFEAGILDYQLLQQYTTIVDEINSSCTSPVSLVPFEFATYRCCELFIDRFLQDGLNPTLELMETYIVPQLQDALRKSNTLRFEQVALVGDAHLGQVVKLQQQRGVEPCTFILQDEPGLRSLTPDSCAVKQLSGMCNALVFLSVSLKDFAASTGKSEGKETQCFLPHDPCKAFDNFLQEALRVDQMLHSATHCCTIITIPLMPISNHTLMQDKAGNTYSCDKCTKTAELVTIAIEQLSKMLNQKNSLPMWSLNYVHKRDQYVQSSSLSYKVVHKAASLLEYFLSSSQPYVKVRMPNVTITSLLQDQKILSLIVPKARETSRIHSYHNRDKEEIRGSHSRHKEQTHNSSTRNKEQTNNSSSTRNKEQTNNSSSSSRNKEQTHNSSSSRNKEQTHNSSSSRNKEQTHNSSSSRNKEQTHNSSSSRNKEQTHNSSSSSRNKEQTYNSSSRNKEQTHKSSSKDKEQTHKSSSKDKEQIHNSNSKDKEQFKDNYSRDGEDCKKSPLNLSPLDDINSPASSPGKYSNDDLDSISTGNLNFTLSPSPSIINSPEDFVESSDEASKDGDTKHQSLPLWSTDNRDKSLSPQRQQYAGLDEPGHYVYQERSNLFSKSSERVHSSITYASLDPQISSVRRTSFIPSLLDLPHSLCGRRSRSPSPAILPLMSLYRPSHNRSLSPIQQHRSLFGGTSFSKGRRSTSRDRSASRGKRSVSRDRFVSVRRRSISRGRRSNSRKPSIFRIRSRSRDRRSISPSRRSISRGRRSNSRKLSIFKNRSRSRDGRSISSSRRSISNSRRSNSRSRRSASRHRRSIMRRRRSFSRGRRSISRGRRSISRNRRSISRGRRSISRSKTRVSRDRRSRSRNRRSISGTKRSFSRSRKSISRGRRSISRGKKSVSRGRSRNSSMEHYSPVRLPAHVPSVQQEKTRESMVKDALDTLRSVHNKECEKYRSNPSIHPDIDAEYRLFCNKKIKSILALGGDPTQYDMTQEWHLFWNKRMEEIFLESWRIKRNQCLALLDAHQKPPSPQPSFRNDRSLSPSSSLFSSSSNISAKDQHRSSMKRKKGARNKSVKSKKMEENQDQRSPPTTYIKDLQVEWSSAGSDMQGKKSLGNHSRPLLSEEEDRREEDYYPGISDLVRSARQRDWDKKNIEKQSSNLKKIDKGGMKGWEQKSLMKHYPDKLERAQPKDQENSKWHQQSLQLKSYSGNESWKHTLDTIGDPFPIHKDFHEAHIVAESDKTEHLPQYKARPHRDESPVTKQDQWLHLSSKQNVTMSSGSPEATVSGAQGKQDSHWDHRNYQDSSETITQIFKSFASNKLDTAESTTHSHGDEVSTTTVLPTTKVDVVNVLEVLTHLGDKLGGLFDPLKLILVRSKELQTNGANPMTIINDQDTKLLLQMIQEKLQGILKNNKLSIIRKVIIEEAEQRLSALLELQDQRSMIGNLNLKPLAYHCLNMDATATIDFIRKVLQCQGYMHLPEQKLMKLYMDVKAEQLKMVGDHHDKKAGDTSPDNTHQRSYSNPEPSFHLQTSKDSVGPHHGSSSTLILPQTESHASTSSYDCPPRRGQQPHSDAAQSTNTTLSPTLQMKISKYLQDTKTGNIHSTSFSGTMNPSKAFPSSQSSTFQNWPSQDHTNEPHSKFSNSTSIDSPQATFSDGSYHQKVSFVGHSQIPRSLEINNVNIRVFRAPDGRASSFNVDNRVNSVLNWEHDLCILWLGSNDIASGIDPGLLAEEILNIARDIERNCGAIVCVCLIEPRVYSHHGPISTEEYKKVQNSVNRKIKRTKKYQVIHFNTLSFQESLSDDGVHWSTEGKEKVTEKFIKVIQGHRDAEGVTTD